MPPSDIEAINRLSKSLRTIKIMLSFFIVLIIANLVALAFIAFTVVTFTKTITDKVTNIQSSAQQSLDFKKQICNSPSLQALTKYDPTLCNGQ